MKNKKTARKMVEDGSDSNGGKENPPFFPSRNKVPMSAASISFALDELDRRLQAEELEEEKEETQEDCDIEKEASRTSLGPSSPELWHRRRGYDQGVRSHPLKFTDQYPHVSIVTTASLPWLTGTAVNPALRAAHLWRRGHEVTLLVPWVDASVQPSLFPDGMVFDAPADQAVSVAEAISKRISFELPPLTVVDATSLKTLDRAPNGGASAGSPIPSIGIDANLGSGMTLKFETLVAQTGEIETAANDEEKEDQSMDRSKSEAARSSSSIAHQTLADAPRVLVTLRGKFDEAAEESKIPFRLVFYPGRYDAALGSIMPRGDVQPLIPLPVHCVVLEEPEHLTWYHTGKRWTRAFERTVPIVGVMHTNYVDYARRIAGDTAAATLKRLNTFLCRQHTHKCIKLSDAVQELPRQETCFVHGVSEGFLAVGATKGAQIAEILKAKEVGARVPVAIVENGIWSFRGENDDETAVERDSAFSKGMYFLGKALWAKGFSELLDRFTEYRDYCRAKSEDSSPLPTVDVYGKGDDLDAIKKESQRRDLPLRFLGPKDHLSPDVAEYKCFVNPSTSDVVATTSAEALAMGKWIVVPRHPCNDWLSSFRNCIVYDDSEGFIEAIKRVCLEDPAPLSYEERQRLCWEAATDRFLYCCASIDVDKGPALARVAAKTGWVGYNLGYSVYAVVSRAIESVRSDVRDRRRRERQRSEAE